MRNFPGLLLPLLLLTAAAGVRAADAAPAGAPAEVTALLREFLVRVDEPAMHDRFWADDLIYTAASGKVQTKADIMRGFAQAPTGAAKPRPPATTYGAEDVVVRVYGDTAALTFRLVAQTPDGRTGHYRNSGTFIRRDGKWQVVTWQATPVPAAEDKPAP